MSYKLFLCVAIAVFSKNTSSVKDEFSDKKEKGNRCEKSTDNGMWYKPLGEKGEGGYDKGKG